MIRFYNCRILSMQNGVNVTEGEVWTDGSVIAHVGETPKEKPAFVAGFLFGFLALYRARTWKPLILF